MNAVSKLQPAQVRELREGFQILDRDSDGVVGKDDVADMLTQLGESKPSNLPIKLTHNSGLPSDPTSISRFFPSPTPQTLTLPTFLTQISTQLSALSAPSELLNAFAAFDDEDSGQVDLAQLKDALLHTAPEPGEANLTEREIEKIVSGFSGRRAFGKGTGGQMGMGKRGEVFRYQEFVQAVAGGNGIGKGGKDDDE
jgi:Ca2+-binding EF-hand superfamily protein